MTVLQTDRILLRRLTSQDAPALFRVTGDPVVMRYWSPGPDADVLQSSERIARINAHWHTHGFGDWAVVDKRTGDLIGFAGLHYIAEMDDVNIGYALERAYWRQGLGYATCRLVLSRGFGELALPRIVAVIDPRNTASIRLGERCGFAPWKRFTWTGHERVAYVITREQWAGAVVPPAGRDYTVVLATPEQVTLLPGIESAAATRFAHSDIPQAVVAPITPLPVLRAAQVAGRLWVARSPGGEAVGFAMAELTGSRAHLAELDVLPSHGRRGVGSSLVRAVEAWASASGLREVTLTTFIGVPWNEPFYAKLGYAVVEECDMDQELTDRRGAAGALDLPVHRRVAMRKQLAVRPDRTADERRDAE